MAVPYHLKKKKKKTSSICNTEWNNNSKHKQRQEYNRSYNTESEKTTKNIAICRYSNFFIINEKSVKNVLTYFQKLQKATGATVNYEKTTVLPINTEETTSLPQKIKIKQRYQTVKIFGIQFNENLKVAYTQNWTTHHRKNS